jgi:hypothetical protein
VSQGPHGIGHWRSRVGTSGHDGFRRIAEELGPSLRWATATPVRATSETAEVAWLTPAEVRERMDEAYATRLLDALDPRPSRVRAHVGLSLLPSSRP